MTTERLAAFHEFKLFRTTEEGHAELWAAQCWCGWVSDIYLTRKEAKSAHIRHFEQTRPQKQITPPAQESQGLERGASPTHPELGGLSESDKAAQLLSEGHWGRWLAADRNFSGEPLRLWDVRLNYVDGSDGA